MGAHPLDFIVRIAPAAAAEGSPLSDDVSVTAFSAPSEPVPPPNDDAWSIGVPFAQTPDEAASTEQPSAAEPVAVAEASDA